MKHWFSDVAGFRRDTLGFFEEHGSRPEQPLRKLHLGFAPVYIVTDPSLVKPIMKAAEPEIDKGRLVQKLRQIVGGSSLTLSGEEHRRRRKATHQQLAKGVSNNYVPAISAIYRRTLAQLVDGEPFDAHQITAPWALRVVCMVLFGEGVLGPSEEAAVIRAVKLVEDDLAEGMFRILPATPAHRYRMWRRLQEAQRLMATVVQHAERRSGPNSLIQALKALGLSGDVLRDEVMMLLLAGHHTTGTASVWTMWHLSADPGLAAAIGEEALSIVGSDGEFSGPALAKAPLSLGFVREIVRLYPSAYWFTRETMRRTDVGGKSLRKGTSLLISPWQMHRDPRFWPDPLRFDIHRSHATPAYIPFGVGPRACVGIGLAILELQLLVLELASTFQVTATVRGELKPRPSITLAPPDVKVELRLRSQHRAQLVAAE